MKLFKSFISAFLMYSRIPIPQIEWKEENRRYALCFFPFVGAVIGIIFILWKYICTLLNIGNFLFAAVSVIIPIIISGGIHLDGFCDVCDAKNSFADKNKKLEIMSDPHIGSFAAINLCLYLILQFGLFCEIKKLSEVFIIAVGYILSRALSGIAAVTFRNAKNGGLLQKFAFPAHRKITIAFLTAIIILSCTAMIFSDIFIGISAIIGAGISFAYYRISAYKNFGGITGDLAGWFLQICEISVLLFAVIGEKLSEVLL